MGTDRTAVAPSGLEWPVGIALGLLTVVVVNLCFIWFALSHAPTVEPSYTHAEHR